MQLGDVNMFEPWQLGMIDEAGYNGITDEHIEKVAQAIFAMGVTSVDRNTFNQACYSCGIDPDNFTREDIDLLEERLNQ